MGFYAPAQLVRDAQQHGIEIRPVDVNYSRWDCTLEDGAVRLGLRMVSGLGAATAKLVEQAQPFRSLDDFAKRTMFSRAQLAKLAKVAAFGSLQLDRRQSLWQSLGRCKESRPLLDSLDDDEPPTPLPAMSPQEQVFADYQTAGLSLRAHPISFYRAALDALAVVSAGSLGKLPDGRFVRVAGLVLLRQRPSTAKGITFVTLEDETGQANLIIRMDVWERFYQVARTAAAFIAHGRLQKQGEIIHVLVAKLENMAVLVHTQSRDFR